MILRVGDGGRALRDGITTRPFKNVNVATVLEYLVQIPPAPLDAGGGGLGLFYPPESRAVVAAAAKLTAVQNWGNIPGYFGTRQSIDFIMDTLGLEWRVQNGSFVAMLGGIINRPGPVISPKTGLLCYSKTNDEGIQFTALANPEVEPGIQVVVADDDGIPFGALAYRVTMVSFVGSSDGDSLMSVQGSKAVPI
jgi:hypothetical protein